MITPVRLPQGAEKVMAQGRRQSNFGNVERIPPSAAMDYGLKVGSTEKFDFTYQQPPLKLMKLDWDFSF